jgi:MFS family permease
VDEVLLRDRLETWRRAGIISDEQSERILSLEAAPVPTPGTGHRRARLAEVVGYVGAAFALGAVGLLIVEFWPQLLLWARITLALLLSIVALLAGAVVHALSAGSRDHGGGRGPDDGGAALRRLAGVLWVAAIAGGAWTTGVIAAAVLADPQRWGVTLVAGVALVLAGVLLAVGRHVLVQLATLIALGSFTAGTLVAIAPLEPGALAFGTMLVGGGTTWALAGAGGWLGPRRSAEITGSIVALIGMQVLTATDWPTAALVGAVLLAGGLVALSLPSGRLHLLYVGAVGLFVATPRLVVGLFADTFGAPATLLASGVLLILMAVGLGRVRQAQGDHDVHAD